MVTYVFAAPDPNRSAESNRRSAGVGLSWTLEEATEQTEDTVINLGRFDKPFRTRITLHGADLVRFLIVNITVVVTFISEGVFCGLNFEEPVMTDRKPNSG